MERHERVDLSHRRLAAGATGRGHTVPLSRLGIGLVALGTADRTHHLWGADLAPLLVAVGGTVLAAVGCFALLDDHAALYHADDALVLLFAALILTATWRAH